MAKKYTVVLIDESGLGNLKKFQLSKSVVVTVVSLFAILAILTVAGLSTYWGYIYERHQSSLAESEINEMTLKVENYSRQIDELYSKVNNIDELQANMVDILGMQKRELPEATSVAAESLAQLIDYSYDIKKQSKDLLGSLENKIQELNESLDTKTSEMYGLMEELQKTSETLRNIPTLWPVEKGRITDLYGYRLDPFNRRSLFHDGVDIGGPYGTNIYSTADGIVVFSGSRLGFGNIVTIDHGTGFMTRYGHNAKNLVSEGEKVKKGQVIALMGSTGRSTGVHLHYEVLLLGMPVNASKFLISSYSEDDV